MSLAADWNLPVPPKEKPPQYGKPQDESKRDVCQGCLTGNFWLCRSFPGAAKKHVEREEEVGKRKKKRRKPTRIEMAAAEEERPSPRVFRRK